MADTSNPLPPPPRPGASSQPKSNADFRALLATPRAERGGYSTKGGTGGASKSGGGGEGKPKKAKKPFTPKTEETEAKEDDGSGYRDRAEERRKGINPDYDGFATEMNTMSGQSAAVESKLTIDESKFLGGDVEHTHLVKGLDYALLQKVRTEEQIKDEEEAAEAKAKAKALRKKEFRTPKGRQVYSAIFQPPRRDVSQQFLPRRMAFVYEMEEGTEHLDIPTTLHRSKADCPKPVESMMGAMDGAVLEKLARIMGYMKVVPGSKAGKRLKRKDKQRMLQEGGLATPAGSGLSVHSGRSGLGNGAAALPAAAPIATPTAAAAAAAADEDEDIFGGVGADYELPEQRRSKAGGAGGKTRDTYFDKKDEMVDLPAVPTAGEDGEVPPPPPPDLPPPPPPAPDDMEMDTAPGPAMPPANYDYDYSAAYGGAAVDPQQQWAQQGYAAVDAYGQPIDPAYGTSAVIAAAELEGPEELTTEDKDAGLGSVFKRDDKRLASLREQDEREKDPNFVSDAYAECYPASHDFGNTVVDSDEEDFSHMDTKEKGQGRTAFNNEEEWQAHKAKQETLPKAAFQFGVKMSDGRKSHKNLSKGRDQKLKNELNQIQGILEKKGSKFGRAFEDAPEESAAAAAPAKRKRFI